MTVDPSKPNAADHPLDLIKALRAIAEQDDDEHGPFVPYARQNGAEGAAIFGVGIGELDGHFGVLRYQVCAFLPISSTGI
jgi:hypothetical protein